MLSIVAELLEIFFDVSCFRLSPFDIGSISLRI